MGDKIQKKIKINLKHLFKQQLKENLLLLFTVLAVFIGVFLGLIVRSNFKLSKPTRLYFGFPGEIFLRMLKLLILPLISSSLITGIAGLSGRNMGQIAKRALIFYGSTTFLAAILGLFLVILISPGSRIKLNSIESFQAADALNGRKINPIDTILDLMRNLFPG